MIFFGWINNFYIVCQFLDLSSNKRGKDYKNTNALPVSIHRYIKTNLKTSVLDFVYHTRCIYLYRSDWKNIMLIMSMILHSLNLRKNKRSCTSMYIIQVVVCDKTIGLQACPIIMTTQEHINFSLIRLSKYIAQYYTYLYASYYRHHHHHHGKRRKTDR